MSYDNKWRRQGAEKGADPLVLSIYIVSCLKMLYFLQTNGQHKIKKRRHDCSTIWRTVWGSQNNKWRRQGPGKGAAHLFVAPIRFIVSMFIFLAENAHNEKKKRWHCCSTTIGAVSGCRTASGVARGQENGTNPFFCPFIPLSLSECLDFLIDKSST